MPEVEDLIDFDAFRKEGFDYFKQSRQGIIRKLKQGSETAGYMTTLNAIEDKYESGFISSNEVVQGYQSSFTSKGLLEPDLMEHRVRRMKINDQFDPIHWFSEYIAQFEPEELSKQMPFVQWKWSLIEEQIIEDEELEQIAKGNYRKPVTGISGAAKNASDGFYTIIKRALKQGYIKPTVAGSIDKNDPQDMVGFLREHHFKIPRIYRRRMMYTLGYGELDDDYWFSYAKLYGFGKVDRKSDMNDPIFIDRSRNQLVGLPSLDNLNTLISYIPGNLLKIMSRRMATPDFQKDGHYWKMLTDYGWVTGFRCWEELFVGGELIEEPEGLEVVENKIKWEEVAEADAYYLTVSTNSDFSEPLLDNEKLVDAAKDAKPETVEIKKRDGSVAYKQTVYKVTASVPDLEPGKTYYAKVCSELGNPYGQNWKSADSEILEFKTAA